MTKAFPEISLADSFDWWTKLYKDNEAVIFKNCRLSYGQLASRVNDLAGSLIRLGINKNDKVGLWMPNSFEWIYTFFALAKIGAVAVPFSTRYKILELENVIKQSDIRTLIFKERYLQYNCIDMMYTIAPDLANYDIKSKTKINIQKFPHLREVICISDKIHSGMINYNDLTICRNNEEIIKERQNRIHPDDAISIIYTSGTTGKPKGAMLKNYAVARKGFDRAEAYGFNEKDRLLLSVPLYTQWGCNALLICLMSHGATIVLEEYFDPEEALHLIDSEKCTIFSGVPTHFRMMIESEAFRKFDVTSLKYSNLTGDFVSVDFCKLVLEKFSSSELINGYGMTETTGLITASRKSDSIDNRLLSVGKPLPGASIKIINPSTGEEVKKGADGEICTKGYYLMKDYYKNAQETNKMIDKYGWLHTGDLGIVLEDGSLKMTGRLKDMIRSGGFNIYANEIEEFLLRFEKVKNVSVIGIPDTRKGEKIIAVIQIRKDKTCSEEEIINFCKTKLSNYKVPQNVYFMDALPSSSSDRIQKNKIKDMIMRKYFRK